MRLWVIAPEDTLPTLQRHQRLCNDRGRRPEYAWLCEQMRRRLPQYNAPSVWWAWYKLDGRAAKPADWQCDLLHTRPAGTPMACIEMEIPGSDVLLADYALWHHACTHGDYLAYDAQEDASFHAKVALAAADEERGPHRSEGRGLPSNAVETAIQASWERMFTSSTWAQFDHTWLDKGRPGEMVLATFAELRAANIVRVSSFQSRQPGLRIPQLQAPHNGGDGNGGDDDNDARASVAIRHRRPPKAQST